VAASLGLAACRVDTTVAVRVRADGSGTVTIRAHLDADAVRAAEAGGGKLEDRVRLGDLPAAGWVVSRWTRAADGSAAVMISKRFGSPVELRKVVTGLNGARGPLRDVSLRRSASALHTKYRLDGVADLAALATGVKDDPELLAKLTAERVDVGVLDQRLLAQVRDGFRLTVTARLPGGSERRWTPKPGQRVLLRASSSTLDVAHVLWLVVGVVLGAIAIVVLVVGEVRTGRRRRRPSRAT